VIKKFDHEGREIQLATTRAGSGFTIIQGKTDQPLTEIQVRSFRTEGQKFILETDAEMSEGKFVCVEGEIYVHLGGQSYHFKPPARHLAQGGSGEYKSPLPGKVIQITVAAGDSVQTGQTLAIVEAMKMENAIKADRDGTVVETLCSEGEIVAQGQILVRVQPLSQ